MYQQFIPLSPQNFLPENSMLHEFIFINKGESFNIDDFDLVFIGNHAECSKQFRKALYQLDQQPFTRLKIADLGDFSTQDDSIKAEIIVDLMNSEVMPCIIGTSEILISCIQNVLEQTNTPYQITFIQNTCAATEHNAEPIYLKKINRIGLQRHLASIAMEDRHDIQQIISLSQCRKSQQDIDAVLRSSDFIHFDLNSIRVADSPGNTNPNPCGFFAEEACTISKSSGNSERLKLFTISAWNEVSDFQNISAQLVGQMCWYFLEGFQMRLIDHYEYKHKLTQYLVPIQEMNYNLKFYKSEISGKWWVAEPNVDEKMEERLIPCTYDDYLNSLGESIPEKFVQLLHE